MYYTVAEQFLCVAAILEMIIYNVTGIKISQQEIAEWFGVVIPEDYDISIKNAKRSNISRMYGMDINERRMQDFFEKKKFPICVKYVEASRISELFFEDRVEKLLKESQAIMCSYSYGYLNGIPSALDVGHVSQIVSMNTCGDIEIYDPGPDDYGLKCVNSFLLYDSMRYRNGGLWIFEG